MSSLIGPPYYVREYAVSRSTPLGAFSFCEIQMAGSESDPHVLGWKAEGYVETYHGQFQTIEEARRHCNKIGYGAPSTNQWKHALERWLRTVVATPSDSA